MGDKPIYVTRAQKLAAQILLTQPESKNKRALKAIASAAASSNGHITVSGTSHAVGGSPEAKAE